MICRFCMLEKKPNMDSFCVHYIRTVKVKVYLRMDMVDMYLRVYNKVCYLYMICLAVQLMDTSYTLCSQ